MLDHERRLSRGLPASSRDHLRQPTLPARLARSRTH
jgi:hypothetical protein